MQVGLINRGEHHFGCIAAGKDLVGTAKREDAALDPQRLCNDFELEESGWFDHGDALYEISFPVSAADGCPDAGLVAFGSDWLGQERAQKEGRAPGNLLIEHDVFQMVSWPALRCIRVTTASRIARRANSQLTKGYHLIARFLGRDVVGTGVATGISAFRSLVIPFSIVGESRRGISKVAEAVALFPATFLHTLHTDRKKKPVSGGTSLLRRDSREYLGVQGAAERAGKGPNKGRN